MKAFIVFATLCCSVAFADYCYNEVVRACDTTNKLSTTPINCTAKYGGIDAVQGRLQRYVNHHFIKSFEYLLISTHFANYEKNRPGFEKLFRGLSDDTWHDAIELIQYISKRGGEMEFKMFSNEVDSERGHNFEVYELGAVATALDMHKKLALEAHEVHNEVARKSSTFHDPEISSHLEHEFMHKHRDIIRKLAGYTTDLGNILKGRDSSLSLFLFDEYLQKQ